MIRGAFGSVPASPIAAGLWQGGFPYKPAAVGENGFDVIVLAARELQPEVDEDYRAFPGVDVICAPLDDDMESGPSPEEAQVAVEAAKRVISALRKKKRVLVTCAMGKNRSGLITALVLIGRYGISGAKAIRWIKRKRPVALTNPSFCAFLEKLQG